MKDLTEDQKLHIACLVEQAKLFDAIRLLRIYTDVTPDLLVCKKIVNAIFKEILEL